MGDGHNRHGPKRWGAAEPLSRGGAGSPSNTMWPEPRSISVPSGVFIHPPFGHNIHGPKTEGLYPFFLRRSWVPIEHNRLGQGLPPCQVVYPDPSSRLATIDMGRKLGEYAPSPEGELGPHLSQCGQSRGLPSCHVLYRFMQPFGHNKHGPKKGAPPEPPFGHGELDPDLTQSRLGRGLPPYRGIY